MEMTFLNTLTVIAYMALGTDFIIEILRVWRRKHSGDISPVGTTIRVSAASIILLKLSFVGDIVLIIGQSIMVTLLITYLTLVIHYRNRV